jgi:4'-phosphopantetheinyl transferase
MTGCPRSPALAFPDCHLWIVPGKVVSDDSEFKMRAELERAGFSELDLARWQRFRPIQKKRQFLESRLAVREVISREFGEAANEIRFSSDPDGRPLLLHSDGRSAGFISLSHSDSWIAVAVSRHFSVGVDIEVAQPLRSAAIQSTFLTPREILSLQEKHAPSNELGIQALWVAKEAGWKALMGQSALTALEICVECRTDGIKLNVTNQTFDYDMLEARMFFVAGQEVVFTRALEPLVEDYPLALIGCITRRLPGGDRDRKTG